MSFLVASWRPPQAAACRGCHRFCYGRSRPTAAAAAAASTAAVVVVVAAAMCCRQGGSL